MTTKRQSYAYHCHATFWNSDPWRSVYRYYVKSTSRGTSSKLPRPLFIVSSSNYSVASLKFKISLYLSGAQNLLLVRKNFFKKSIDSRVRVQLVSCEIEFLPRIDIDAKSF